MLENVAALDSLRQCFSTGVPRAAARYSAKTDRNCPLGRNPQSRFYTVVTI